MDHKGNKGNLYPGRKSKCRVWPLPKGIDEHFPPSKNQKAQHILISCPDMEKHTSFMVLLALFGHFYGSFWHFWHVRMFCGEFTFVAIYAHFLVKLFWHKPYLCNFFCLFPCLNMSSNCILFIIQLFIKSLLLPQLGLYLPSSPLSPNKNHGFSN